MAHEILRKCQSADRLRGCWVFVRRDQPWLLDWRVGSCQATSKKGTSLSMYSPSRQWKRSMRPGGRVRRGLPICHIHPDCQPSLTIALSCALDNVQSSNIEITKNSERHDFGDRLMDIAISQIIKETDERVLLELEKIGSNPLWATPNGQYLKLIPSIQNFQGMIDFLRSPFQIGSPAEKNSLNKKVESVCAVS